VNISKTVRQNITELLRLKPCTAKDISKDIRISEREVYGHLEHIRKSAEKDFVINPAECRKCGFTFDMKKHLKKPGKCPECRSTWIDEPDFFLKG